MSEASLAEAHAALQVHERVVLVIDSTHSSGMYVWAALLGVYFCVCVYICDS